MTTNDPLSQIAAEVSEHEGIAVDVLVNTDKTAANLAGKLLVLLPSAETRYGTKRRRAVGKVWLDRDSRSPRIPEWRVELEMSGGQWLDTGEIMRSPVPPAALAAIIDAMLQARAQLAKGV